MNKQNMVQSFIDMLGSLGGKFDLGKTTEDAPKKEHSDGRFKGGRRPLNRKSYRTAGRGYLMRLYPKRDKSISARQWKKQVKARRRAAKVEA